MLANESYDSSDVLNSSFYSSTSINTLDHAKTFRNSLILADLDGPGYGNLTGQTSQRSEDAGEENVFPAGSEKETTTMKMSTSPSLSALAGILSEKSRHANEKLKSSELYGSATIEEEEDVPELRPERPRDNVTARTAGGTSPNLFELNDNEEVYCPDTNLSDNNLYSAQPDYLSSPRATKEDYSRTFRPNKQEPLPITEQKLSETRQQAEPDIRQPFEPQPQPKTQRTVSRTSTEQNQQSKKRRNFFSFLKRRNTDTLKTDTSGIPNSMTFSLSQSSSPSQLAPERMTKKSYSSSNIFSTFRKNRDIKRENTHSQEHKMNRKEPINDQIQEDKDPDEKLTKTLPKKRSSDISKRKPTPLNYEHLHDGEEQMMGTAESSMESAKSVSETNTVDPIITKLDTGEVRFPRSLDKQEVDSIVSIERSRSTKSNKRSSIASHRRSLTETLSANAQNEGMFIMEASSVVLSTPDLTKSPASSILRNGKFDPIEFSSNNSVILDDQSEHALSANSGQNALLVPEPIQNRLSMASIEERLNELTIDSEDDEKPAKQPDTQNLDEDPEFMSDIMEFARIINFGDGVNFDFDSKADTLEPEISTLKPLAKSASTLPTTEQFIDEQEAARPGLGITYDNIIPEHQANPQVSIQNNEDDEFENEDFNTLGDVPQQSPQLKAFMPEFEPNRPLSMSFRGLKAPSFNASITASSATDSVARADHKSLASSERRHLNCINFSSKIILYETYGEDEYDRKPEIATCNQLTPQLAQLIKAELNELKSTMEVHEDSRCYTHFF